MKSLTTTFAAMFALFASLNTAFAAEAIDTAVTYNSGILVLAFAGFLALVVVVQAVPALISLYGMIKVAAEAAKTKHATSSASEK
jgi:hypothetical protein